MKDVKVGDRLTIHCYKHNGKIDRISDEAIVLDVTDEMLVCANDRTKLTESDGRSHRTKEIKYKEFLFANNHLDK